MKKESALSLMRELEEAEQSLSYNMEYEVTAKKEKKIIMAEIKSLKKKLSTIKVSPLEKEFTKVLRDTNIKYFNLIEKISSEAREFANEKLKNEIVALAEETGIPCRILERNVFYMNAYYCPESLKTLWKDIDLLSFEKDILGSFRDNFSTSINKKGWQSSNVC